MDRQGPCAGVALWLIVLLVWSCCPSASAQADDDFDCNYYEDTCYEQWKMDGSCDGSYQLCLNQDCWDCDPCKQYDYTSCQACTSANCHWCPGDGVCRSQALGETYWSLHSSKISSCSREDQWQSTCQNNGNNNNEATNSTTLFSDPLYEAMEWSYDLINIKKVWEQGITGAGVHVRVNDVGLDSNHPEFANRFRQEDSCPSFNASVDKSSQHGTGVTSILAADGNNDHCAVGIAPGVTLSACTFREDWIETELAEMLGTQLENVDISNNAWGPEICVNLNYLRLRRQRQRKIRQRQLKEEGICIFDPNHVDSPCEICEDLVYHNSLHAHDDLSQPCASKINAYCTYYYNHDPEACAEFLDIFTSCEYHVLSRAAHDAIETGVQQGRNGKGIVYVFAGGNNHEAGGFTNSDGFINSRYTITVGAVGKNGAHASYSTPGASLFLTAPGGDFDWLSNNMVAHPGGGCGDITGGTSFSAPVVSGVVALMLEVNSNLGWRDVQGILAETSQLNDSDNNETWTFNGAGLHHSYKYGFGLVDAAAAVDMARNWVNYGPEQQIMATSGAINLTIADGIPTTGKDSDNPVVSTQNNITIEASDSFLVESVVLNLNLLHASRGDLEIILTSPSKTESILHPAKRPENRQLAANETWELMTVRNWNEPANGNWQISIVDHQEGDRSECANRPYEYLYLDRDGKPDSYTCLHVENLYHCYKGEINRPDEIEKNVDRGRNNLTAAEACCVCGGGVPVSETDVLVSWTLAIYGHDSLQETTVMVEEHNSLPPAHADVATNRSGLVEDPSLGEQNENELPNNDPDALSSEKSIDSGKTATAASSGTMVSSGQQQLRVSKPLMSSFAVLCMASYLY